MAVLIRNDDKKCVIIRTVDHRFFVALKDKKNGACKKTVVWRSTRSRGVESPYSGHSGIQFHCTSTLPYFLTLKTNLNLNIKGLQILPVTKKSRIGFILNQKFSSVHSGTPFFYTVYIYIESAHFVT